MRTANVAFFLDSDKYSERFIEQILLPSDEIDIAKASWLPDKTVDQVEQIAKTPFPQFIKSITFNSKDEVSFYTISFSDDAPEFNVSSPEGRSLDALSKKEKNKTQ